MAIGEGLALTVIAGSTLALVKVALVYLGPLTITGLRYLLAALLLLPFVLRRADIARFSSWVWLRFFLIGLSFYVVGNGALFWGLKYIPATTGSLLLSLIPLLVLIEGGLWLREIPTRVQMAGVVVSLTGSALFFSSGLGAGEGLGMAIVGIGLIGNASFGVLSREVARQGQVDTFSLAAIPLALGGAITLPLALAIEGPPGFAPVGWGVVLWLAAANTAIAYLLYNHALRVLAAFELSVILNLTPLVTAGWAWLLLGERLGMMQVVGMVVVILGVALVQEGKKV